MYSDYIDIESLRRYLIDYLGTLMIVINPGVMFDLEKVSYGSDDDVIEVALAYGIDLDNYSSYSR